MILFLYLTVLKTICRSNIETLLFQFHFILTSMLLSLPARFYFLIHFLRIMSTIDVFDLCLWPLIYVNDSWCSFYRLNTPHKSYWRRQRDIRTLGHWNSGTTRQYWNSGILLEICDTETLMQLHQEGIEIDFIYMQLSAKSWKMLQGTNSS